MSCPSLPEIDAGEWGEILLRSLQGRRYPLGGTLELTDRCNLGCLHCYINQPAANRSAQARELSTAQVISILDQITDAGCLFLLLTGGEIFIRRDFPEIYRHSRQRGLVVTLFTNGTLVTPRIADLLAELRPHTIEITLYGATSETYEKVTQAPGSYSRCRRGIDLLLERDIPLVLKSVLMKANQHELAEMQSLAEQLGVPYRYDGMLWPRLDGGTQPFEQRISLQELVALDRTDPQRQQEWERTAALFKGTKTRNEYLYSCGAGMHTFHIDSTGKVSICTMSRRPNADMLQVGFLQAWEQIGELRKEKRKLATPCIECSIGALCTQCPGWSQVVHGDDETPVDFVCQLGHLRSSQVQQLHLSS